MAHHRGSERVRRSMGRKPVVLCVLATLLLALYVVSYFCVRTLFLYNCPIFGPKSVGVVTFSYLDDGPVHAYGLSEIDSATLFLGSRTPSARSVVSKILLGHRDPGRMLYGDYCWAWKLYTPLERVEMLCRGMAPVFLTSEEKAELLRTAVPVEGLGIEGFGGEPEED